MKPWLVRASLIPLVALLVFSLAVCGAAPPASPGGAPPSPHQGNTYYVAPGGDDGNPGTIDYPWQTVQHAADTLVAGDTVYIRAGTYPERVVPQNSGSAGETITYAAYPGDAVTIDGSSVVLPDTLAGLFEIANKSYIRVAGLHVSNAGPYDNNAGILVLANSSHIIVENNHTNNTRSSGIGIWASQYITVTGNTIEQGGTSFYQECLTVAETSWFEVSNNEVANCHKDGICVKDNTAHGRVYRNRVHHGAQVGIYVDSWTRHTHDIAVFQNIVHDNENDGLAVASEEGGPLDNISFYNNLAYHNQYNGLNISINGGAAQHPISNVQVINNTFYNNGWTGGFGGIIIEDPDAQNIVIRNNIVSQNLYFQILVTPGVSTQTIAIDYNLIDGYRGNVGDGETRGTDYVEGDPLFVSAAGAAFHLQGQSPAIDSGSAAGAPADDFDGRSRPLDGDGDGLAAYDIGAYEYVALTHWVYLPVAYRD